MSKHLDRELDRLRSELVEQMGVVENMIQMAVRSLMERRVDLAELVLEHDAGVDAKDIQIEEECLKLIALHQPVATDMRWLITVVKVNSDLERIADLACNIAERAKAITYYPLFPVPEEFNEMVTATTSMVRIALDSFVDGDSSKAKDVIGKDDTVDALNGIMIDRLQQMMKDDAEQIEPAVHCFSASRHLERIADLAENVAEDVIYLVEGDIVRHKHGIIIQERTSETQP